MDAWTSQRPGRAGRTGTGAAVGAAAGALALGPALARGYVLAYDMVFVPDPPVTASTLGLDGSVPRAVPTDLLVALASRALPGDVVQKLVLLAAFVLAGAGAARLAPSRPAAVAAAAVYAWNPWVAERLLVGHWAFLLGYAGLPWLVAAAVAARGPGASGGPASRLCLAAFAVSCAGSTAWLLGALVVGAVLLRPPRARGRVLAAWAACAAACAGPWALPVLLAPGLAADPAGVDAFAARPDTPLGVAGSLLSLGGVWNAAAVPAERGVVLVAVLHLAAVLAVLAAGGRRLWAAWDGAGAGLVVAGATGLAAASLASLPGGAAAARALTAAAPAFGLLRDGHKLAAPYALVVACCAGLAVERARRGAGAALPALAAAAAAAPVVLLPGLAWGGGGRLAAVDYPAEWTGLRARVAALDPGRDVASLPASYYRRFAWNGSRVLLDPLPRFLPRVVVVDDDLPLRAGTVRGEDRRGAALGAAVRGRTPLADVLPALGVQAVVVAADQPDPDPAVLAGLRLLWAGQELRLYAVPGPVAEPPRAPAAAAAGLAAWALAGLGSAAAATGCTAAATRRGRPW